MALQNPVKLYKAMPNEFLWLVDMGYVRLETHSSPGVAGMTRWDKKDRAFVVSVHNNALSLSMNALRFILNHELGHVAFNHTALPPCGSDLLVATDIQINWWYRDEDEAFKEIEDLWGGRLIHSEEWLERLKLNKDRPYHAEVLHALLHEQAQEGSTFCQCEHGVQDTKADAIAAATVASDSRKGNHGFRKQWGSEALGSLFGDSRSETPDWAKIIHDFARRMIEFHLIDARKWTRPNEGLFQQNIYVPRYRPRPYPRPTMVYLIIDASGSMWGTSALSHTAAAVASLLTNGVRITLVTGDTEVQVNKEIKSAREIEIKGGGGTDIVPMYEAAKDAKAIVVLTDTEFGQWPESKGIPTLWIIPKGITVPFGEVANYE